MQKKKIRNLRFFFFASCFLSKFRLENLCRLLHGTRLIFNFQALIFEGNCSTFWNLFIGWKPFITLIDILISISINRLFEPTYRMYESLKSIQTMLPKCYVKLLCVWKHIFHIHFFIFKLLTWRTTVDLIKECLQSSLRYGLYRV